MTTKCVSKGVILPRSIGRRWRSVFSVVVMLPGVVRTSMAFGGLKRPLLPSANVIHHALPVPQEFTAQVSLERPRFAPRRTRRLYSSNPHHDVNDLKRRNSIAPTRHLVLDSIEESIERDIISNLPETTSNVVLLVGVSGGCDSVGLLHALVRLLARRDDDAFQLDSSDTFFRIHVVHFNHKQRGKESDGDALFVQELCDEFNLPCHVYEWDLSSNANFSQDKARQWRRSNMYSLLQSFIKNDQEQGVIVTAHHCNDSQESLLLKMLRGVHLTNLVGMDAVVVDSEDAPGVTIARPMLNICKADIVDFLESNNLKWREDESNASDKYLRNRVRNELIPLLSDMVGGEDVLQKRLGNVSSQSRELKDDLSNRAQGYLKKMQAGNGSFLISGESLDLVKREALHQWAKACMGFPLPYDQLERIVAQIQSQHHQQTWTLQVGRGWSIVRSGVALVARKEGMENIITASSVEREIEWSLVDSDCEPNEVKDSLQIQLPDSINTDDCDFVVSDAGQTGTWAFTPPWRENPIRLKDFLRGQKVPLHLRGSASVVFLKRDGGLSLVAVFVEQDRDDNVFGKKRGKWIVDGKFSIGAEVSTGCRIRLKL